MSHVHLSPSQVRTNAAKVRLTAMDTLTLIIRTALLKLTPMVMGRIPTTMTMSIPTAMLTIMLIRTNTYMQSK
jgi:hypothetical protein